MQLKDPSLFRQQAFVAGAGELGFNTDWDFNGPTQEGGAGYIQSTTTRDFKRASAFTAYIAPHLGQRKNLTVEYNACATRLLLDAERGVLVADPDDAAVDTARDAIAAGRKARAAHLREAARDAVTADLVSSLRAVLGSKYRFGVEPAGPGVPADLVGLGGQARGREVVGDGGPSGGRPG